MAIGDVRLVEATEEDDSQLQASTPLQGPTTASAPMNSQDTEAPCQDKEASRLRGFAPRRGGSEDWGNHQQEDESIHDNEPQADDGDDNQPLHQPSYRQKLNF